MEEEIWKPIIIEGNDTGYQVSNQGNVKNKSEKNIGYLDTDTVYKKVVIKNKYFLVHRLVLSAFNPIENMKDYHIHHKDGNRTNNRPENLEWIIPSEHALMEFKRGKYLIGKKGRQSITFKGFIGQFNKNGMLKNIIEGLSDIKDLNLTNSAVYRSVWNTVNQHKGFVFRRFPKNIKPEIGKKYDLYDPIFTQFFKTKKNTKENTNVNYKQIEMIFS